MAFQPAYHLQMRFIVALLLILVLAAGGAYVVAGRAGGPSIEIAKAGKVRRRHHAARGRGRRAWRRS